MKEGSFRCLACGAPVEVVRFDNLGETITFSDGKAITCWSKTMIGWLDTYCQDCGLYYTRSTIDDIINGRITGWAIDLSGFSDEEMDNFVRSLRQCPEAIDILCEEVENGED